jgi:hypothetical protein
MKKLVSKICWVMMTSAWLVWLSAAGVQAQEKSKGQPPSQPTAVGDKELRSFAKSYLEFHKIRMEYEPALNKANDPQEKNKLEQEAVAKFGKAVEKQGLTLESYFRIFQTVNTNETVREKALKLIEEERKKA